MKKEQSEDLAAPILSQSALFALPQWNNTELEHFKLDKKCAGLITRLKQKTISALQHEKTKNFLRTLPEPGEQIHMLSNGAFPCWKIVQTAMELCGSPAEHLFLSTWTMNLQICRDIIEHLEGGSVRSVTICVNDYLKRRSPHIWGYLVEHLRPYEGSLVYAIKNHAKVAAWKTLDGRCYVISGSANLTVNPRIEQNFIAQSPELYNFYINEFKKTEPKKRRIA